MDIKRIIRESMDFEWIKNTDDLVQWESLRVGDEVELVYTDMEDGGAEFWNGTKGTVVKAGEFVSIDTMIDGKEKRLLFDDSFDTEPNRRYMFRVLNSINESDDFGWIKDSTTYEYLVGKALEFDPIIKDDSYLTNVLGILNGLGFTSNFDFEFVTDKSGKEQIKVFKFFEEEGIMGLILTKNGVVWTGEYIDEDTYQEHIDNYANRPVEILNGRDLFPSNLNESTDGVDPFKWIRDIELATPDLFRGRVDDFIERFASQWDGVTITFEPISDSYSSGVREIGRVYMDEGDYSWYWDLIHDSNDESYIVEIYEKPAGWDSYEAIDRERLSTLNEAILYIFDTMAEE
jgi:hypothetical protein